MAAAASMECSATRRFSAEKPAIIAAVGVMILLSTRVVDRRFPRELGALAP
jgi:hypothetical protein